MQDNLIPISYRDSARGITATGYADTLVYDEGNGGKGLGTLCAVRFGGYPEMVNALADSIWGGGTVEVETSEDNFALYTLRKQYSRQKSNAGIYAEATLIADNVVANKQSKKEDDKPAGKKRANGKEKEEEEEPELPVDLPPRTEYIFCTPGDEDALYAEIDRKTACPLIPEFREYVLTELKRHKFLRELKVLTANRAFDAWALTCTAEDRNIIDIVEAGLKNGHISIPGGKPGLVSPFQSIKTMMEYLGEFGTVLGERIKNLFVPLFDPTKEPLSEEVLEINDYIRAHAGYDLYDAQLAVAEAIKRQLQTKKVGLIVAECGSGKTKIASTALGALWGLHAAAKNGRRSKTLNIVLCPSHMTGKWVREIEETLPNSYAVVVSSINEVNNLLRFYDAGERNCYMVISKEQARDGYMRYPAVVRRLSPMELEREDRDDPIKVSLANAERRIAFCCPDCGAPILMPGDKDVGYMVDADQFFFMGENRRNHKCSHCGTPLWTTLNPSIPATENEWIKIGDYGFVYRKTAIEHLTCTEDPVVLERLQEIVDNPSGYFPPRGARHAYPLSAYIKRKLKGRIDGLLCDEIHQYSLDSGQGDAMGELVQAARKVVGMTATLINGYSSGMFHLLYRLVAPLMKQDGKNHEAPGKFNDEYGVTQRCYETQEAEYNANRRTSKKQTMVKQLPGVSPLVYSRFLLEYAVFLSLMDMGANLPEYEEIPIPLDAPEDVMVEYDRMEGTLKEIMKEDRQVAQKILSSYMNLLLAYPDQPYNQKPIYHPIYKNELIKPCDKGSIDTMSPKDKELLDIVDRKIAAGEKVMIYTNWTRLDTQHKLKSLLLDRGYNPKIMRPQIKPSKREQWVEDRLDEGMQVLITNPSLVETGLDLNAFTTLIFYDVGMKLFTFRQASRRSWRINQKAPRIEVYILYYRDTMQNKMVKLMANKLAVAGIIEGNLSDEGLSAMAESEDLMAVMAKELANGIKDNVEDIGNMFKKMAFLKPERESNETEKHATDTEPAAPVVSFTANKPSRAAGRAITANYPFVQPKGESRSLLERSEVSVMETWVKRKKVKVETVLEGQCSMFDEKSA